ncbi:MAG: adenylosuccinate synthase [bacterium]|nr:adenylosuccinate synthase [bacterium]
MGNLAVVGAQWGDEGKGKITDLLARHADVVVRYGGGPNAGHTVMAGDRLLKLHLVPSGILYPTTACLIGGGCVVDPESLLAEIDRLHEQGLTTDHLRISETAHVIMPYHRTLDRAEESARANPIGTTGRGIGPSYGDKVTRQGIRMLELVDPAKLRRRLEEELPRINRLLTRLHDLEPLELAPLLETLSAQGARLKPYVMDTALHLHRAIREGKRVLFEGAQGALLDLEMGTYPFVTSSYPVAGGASVGSGVGPGSIGKVLGIAKAYATRVGGGPFPSELHDEVGQRIRDIGHEYGTTTGRPRRCGWFDAVALRLATRANGLDALAITKLDVLDAFETLEVVVAYRDGERLLDEFPADLEVLERCTPVLENHPGWQTPTGAARTWDELPAAARAYLDRLAELVGVPVELVSVGAEREATLTRPGILDGWV